MQKKNHFVSTAVSEVELGFLHVERDAGCFCHHFNIQCLAGLYANNQFISFRFSVKYITRHIAILNSHLSLALVQGCKENAGDK